MKTAIIYVSKYGTTRRIAELIAGKLPENDQIVLIDLNEV